MIPYLFTVISIFVLCKNWAHVIFSKITGIPIQCIKLRSGISFVTDHGRIGKADLTMFSETWYREFYTPPFFEINPTDTVIDVGANNGYFSVFAALKARSGRVFAFEPLPRLAQLMRSTIEINRLNNITLEEAALAEFDGESDFFISKTHNGMHNMIRAYEGDERTKVKTVSLQKFCEMHKINKIDFLKLDCEGAEFQIVLSLPPDFLARIDKISLEYHDALTEYSHVDLVTFLTKNNFSVREKNGYLYALNKAFLK